MKSVNALTGAMRRDAAAGRRTLSGITSWNGGAHSTTIVRNFAIPADEPAVVGGTNRGPSPTELVLTGLSACIAVGIAYSAAEDGIEVDLIEIDVAGDLDLGGFLEVRRAEGPELEHRRCDSRQDIYPGLEEIRLTVRVDADAPREKIEELVDHAYRRSPVAAALGERVPIRVCIEWEEAKAR
ncbi:MAG: OsmC family protein [Methanoculleus sp.]|uniref:OsmC family protein n=1 Tax=unclassified Methanoculleus TaxID=2619537 RepID=UPI0025DE9595|nr:MULTISPECIES: OsmC family protein [unclassified Methanoculleus]MCK9316750.1 OsmC family protein [Methanoculleus sp.]MDD2252789.1 OsmC family protein [Methanoculleus sp.]MDD3215228.1 OsmC family protein [Methanoculleus sp.]MDD4313032.1 OsmC family protein [Methanoculleus sp.]MDD4469619.1 OsmC family protein [Methanoculleus sp.]